MLPLTTPLKAKMLWERAIISFLLPRSLLALKNQNRAKAYLGDIWFSMKHEAWLQFPAFPFKCSHIVQADNMREVCSVKTESTSCAATSQREGHRSKYWDRGSQGGLLNPPNLECRHWAWTRDALRTDQDWEKTMLRNCKKTLRTQ